MEEVGTLSEKYTAVTPLDFLFTSTGAGQGRTITGYDGTTKTASVTPDWEVTPDYTSYYRISGIVNGGTAAGGTANTITLDGQASAEDNAYNGMRITVDPGTVNSQVRTITSYNGSLKLAVVDSDWASPPTDTSPYEIFGTVTQGTAQSATASSITLATDASAETGAYDNLEILITVNPDAEHQRDEVRDTLLQVKRDINHSVQVLVDSEKLQESNALGGLAQFLGTTPEMISVLMQFVAGRLEIFDYLQTLLSPIPQINSQIFSPTVNTTSFVTQDINEVSSIAVFEKLKEHGIIITVDEADTSGVVSSTFNKDTPLTFLFERTL